MNSFHSQLSAWNAGIWFLPPPLRRQPCVINISDSLNASLCSQQSLIPNCQDERSVLQVWLFKSFTLHLFIYYVGHTCAHITGQKTTPNSHLCPCVDSGTQTQGIGFGSRCLFLMNISRQPLSSFFYFCFCSLSFLWPVSLFCMYPLVAFVMCTVKI